MDASLFPTKGNLMLAKNTLALSKQGYELLDKKRNILIREMMLLVDEAAELQQDMGKVFAEAYQALQHANITLGISEVERLSHAVPIEEDVEIRFRSVMGVELPVVRYTAPPLTPQYGFYNTNPALDEAVMKFAKVKEMTLRLAEVENAVRRFSVNIKTTQNRAKYLKNVLIPRYETIVKSIQDILDEKEREEFTRLKVIKKQKMKND